MASIYINLSAWNRMPFEVFLSPLDLVISLSFSTSATIDAAFQKLSFLRTLLPLRTCRDSQFKFSVWFIYADLDLHRQNGFNLAASKSSVHGGPSRDKARRWCNLTFVDSVIPNLQYCNFGELALIQAGNIIARSAVRSGNWSVVAVECHRITAQKIWSTLFVQLCWINTANEGSPMNLHSVLLCLLSPSNA